MLSALWLIQRRLSRRGVGPRKQEPIRVVAKQGVGPKAQIVVVDMEGSRYVLGVTEGGVSVVDRLPLPAADRAQSQTVETPESAEASESADTELSPPVPLPLRRTLHRPPAASASTGRAFGRSTPPARGAAEVLRRALGA